MASLKRLAQAIQSGEAEALNHSVLIYGPPKAGKTHLVGTAAMLPEVRKVWWFDLENGAETLLNMGLTDEQLDKVEYIKIADTRNEPWAIETMLKTICDKHGKGVWISGETGRTVDERSADKEKDIFFRLADRKHDELVVIDSGTQLGMSALNGSIVGKDHSYKLQLDDYGLSGKWLGDIMTTIQQAKYTNFVMITHETVLEDQDGKTKFFPVCGTTKFSLSMAKFFGTVIYCHMKMKKHVAGSTTNYANDKLTGSRRNIDLEKGELSMKTVLIDSGILARMT